MKKKKNLKYRNDETKENNGTIKLNVKFTDGIFVANACHLRGWVIFMLLYMKLDTDIKCIAWKRESFKRMNIFREKSKEKKEDQ